MTHHRCDVCKFSDEHGFLPRGVHIHCGGDDGCHRNWRGLSEAHCASCHRHFGGEVAFTAHIADGICRDPSNLKTKAGKPRFRTIERKDGVVWVKAETMPRESYQSIGKGSGAEVGSRGKAERPVACETRNVRRRVERVA